MATHRSQHTASTPDFEFQVAISILEASDRLAARRRPINLQTLAKQLRAQPFALRPSRAQIERGLAQVQCWREQILARDILHQRDQLLKTGDQLRAQQRQLTEDLFYLNQMLEAANAVLKNTLLEDSRQNANGTPASANAARPLQ